MERDRVRSWRVRALLGLTLFAGSLVATSANGAIIGGEEGVVFRDQYASFLSLSALLEFVDTSPAAPQTQMLQLAFETLELCRIRTALRLADAGYTHHFDFRPPGSRSALLYRVSVPVSQTQDSGRHVVEAARATLVIVRRLPDRVPIRTFEDLRVLSGALASSTVRDHVQARLAVASESADATGEIESSLLIEVSVAPVGEPMLPPMARARDYEVGFHWFGFEGQPGTESQRFTARVSDEDRSMSVWPVGDE